MISLIPLELWQLKMEFSDDLINLKTLSEFLILMSKLFHSIKVDGKNELFGKRTVWY